MVKLKLNITRDSSIVYPCFQLDLNIQKRLISIAIFTISATIIYYGCSILSYFIKVNNLKFLDLRNLYVEKVSPYLSEIITLKEWLI